MSERDDDDPDGLYAELAGAVERVNEAEARYHGTIDKFAILDAERDEVRAEVEGTRRLVRTLCEILIKRGGLNEGHRRLLERVSGRAAAAGQVVRLKVVEEDKRAIAGPGIDCASLLHLCRARCCTMTVELTREDIADGIKWEIDRPYVLRHDADGWCHHIDRGTGGCHVYDARPSTCRKFDCRNDARIWIDFDARLPAPLRFPFADNGGPTFAAPAGDPSEEQ
ncbi:MAG TPA: YkgJ family cysteine cluster protein [Kofleriaceae bacterium]|nr:YkgJ family cysteine cluster protein [Kofleriaceae bacterium]